jgi:hypothetical protein
MKRALVLIATLLVAGCLEVEQHPGWMKGHYAGKPDELPYQKNFNGDRLSWNAAVTDRTQLQNEYLRAP